MRSVLPIAALLAIPLFGQGTRPAAHASALPSYKDLKFPPLRQVQIPEVATYALPNGMRLYLLEDHELPLVRGFARVRTGNLFDPPDKIGLADMTGRVMRTGGAKSKTGDQLDEQLENIAASVESSIGEDSGQVSFLAMKENTDEVLGAFKDVLTSPEFRQDKIELAKNELRSLISRRNDNPHGIAVREFDEIVYGRDTPYGWRMEYATVNRITRDDLLKFYERYFFPANTMLAIYGDFSTPQMRVKLETLFADWTVKQPAVPPFPPVKNKPEPGIFLATKKDVTQTFLEMGHLGGLLKDKDYPALDVMTDILGSGFRSRLFQRVRTQLGYAYSIHSAWAASYDHPGLFQISGSTKSISTVPTIKAIEEEIDRIRTSEVTDEELKSAKDSVLNGFVFAFDTRFKTLSRLITYEYFGYPKDFIFQYQKAIANVAKADVLRVAREHIKPAEMVIVAVGNPDDFGEPLTKLGLPVKPIDLTIPEDKPAVAKSDRASVEKGKRLLHRVQQAVGGADRLGAVKDITTVVEVQLDPSAGGMKIRQTNRWIAPTQFRQESELPVGKLIAYSDGTTGWLATPKGVVPLPEPQVKQIQTELFRLYTRLLLSDRDPNRSVNFIGDNTIEISDQSGHSVKLTVDDKTGLPQKESYQQPGMGGPGNVVEETYGEFKEVDGIKVPFQVTIHRAGKKFGEVIIHEYQINTGLKPEDLSKKP